MFNLDKLMTLVENSTAMNEQYEDAYPEMSMLEATAYLPAMITESQLELAESVNEQTEQVMTIMTESADPRGDLESLTEASLQGIKDRILGFLKKVKEVVMSIINKIAQTINMMVKSNKGLVSKYGGKINEAKCTGLTVENCYNAKADSFKPHLDVQTFMDKYTADNIPEDVLKMQEFVKNNKDIDKSDLHAEMINTLTGLRLDSSGTRNWGSEYLIAILGERTTVRYGEGIFTLSTVKSIMSDTKLLSNCKEQYNKILKDAQKKEKEIQKLRNTARNDDKRAKDNESAKTFTSTIYECYNLWLSRYQMAYRCVSQAKNVEVRAVQVMQRQAKFMFSKMLKASTGKGSDEE